MTANTAQRRYLQRFMPSMALYLLLLFGSIWAIENLELEGLALAAVAVLPSLPLLAVIWAVGMFIVEQQDEYLRMRQVRQALVATAFMLATTTVWGFLESAGAVPHVPLYWAYVIWCFGLGIDPLLNLVRDRQPA